jgi:hypothetical protein
VVFRRPVAYAEGILDLMRACAADGRADAVECLFHRLPRVPRSPGLDDVLAEAGRVYAVAKLAAGDLRAAEQACRDGFPEGRCFGIASRRLEAAALLMERHLADGDCARAAGLFLPFVPGQGRPSWAPAPSAPETAREREARESFGERLAEAAGALFDHCERNRRLDVMERLYEALPGLEPTDAVLRLRLEKAAALARLAVESGRLSDGVRYYEIVTGLAHLDPTGEAVSRTLMLLVEAYRETGDETTVSRLTSGD